MNEWSFVILVVKIIFIALIIFMCCSRRRKNKQPQMVVVQTAAESAAGAAPYTLSQHSGVGRSSIGRWTVVHTRNSNMSESRIAPDAEAGGFLPSSSGQQHQQLINPSSLPMPPPPYEEDPHTRPYGLLVNKACVT